MPLTNEELELRHFRINLQIENLKKFVNKDLKKLANSEKHDLQLSKNRIGQMVDFELILTVSPNKDPMHVKTVVEDLNTDQIHRVIDDCVEILGWIDNYLNN